MKGTRTVTDSANISEKYFDLVPEKDQQHLLNSLRSLARLQPATPSFPLYGKSDWSVVTDFLNSKEVQATHPPKWLLEYELSRESKFGPQGGHAPWEELRENALLYFSRPQQSVIEPTEKIMAKYRKLYLEMQSPASTLEQMKGSDKVQERANGWRLFSLKKTDERAQRDALYLISSNLWKQGWAYFFSSFKKQKKRLFVPMPFSANIRQGQWFNRFLAAIQEDLKAKGQLSQFAFWGDKIGFQNLFMGMMTDALKQADPTKLVFVVRDFDKMDTSVGVSQKSKSFIPKLAAAYKYGKGSHSYQALEEAMLFSNKCPIATPDGMWTGDHGEASGATVTNGGETCCNEDFDARLWEIVASRAGNSIHYQILCSYGNGDDGITVVELEDTAMFQSFKEIVKAAAAEAAKEGGYVIQAEKWDITIGTYGKYCQYLPAWDIGLKRVRMRYPASLILNAIVNPEKQYKPSDWDKSYRDLDIISKLANGFDLEYFEALIDYVDYGMKFRLLGRTEEETKSILSKWDRYMALQPGSREYQVVNSEWEANPWENPVVKYLVTRRGISK